MAAAHPIRLGKDLIGLSMSRSYYDDETGITTVIVDVKDNNGQATNTVNVFEYKTSYTDPVAELLNGRPRNEDGAPAAAAAKEPDPPPTPKKK